MNTNDVQDLLAQIAEQSGVTPEILTEWLHEQVVIVQEWDEESLETVRRIRRLTSLGVNLEGVEIVLHMRQELLVHQSRVKDLEAEIQHIRDSHVQEIARLMRQFAHDL
ncbi:MAG: hypothetical protein ABI947_18670 [Chloroflexota bacterium]